MKEEPMPEIDNLSTERGFEQVTIKFTPRDVEEIVTAAYDSGSTYNSHPAAIRLRGLLVSAHHAFTVGEGSR